MISRAEAALGLVRRDQYVVDTDVSAAFARNEGFNRNHWLVGMWHLIQHGCPAPEQFRRAVTYIQHALYHHFDFQPLMPDGSLVTDPIVLADLGYARCGAIARFVVDLFEAGGHPGRLLVLGRHTVAEIRYGDKWIVVDADVLPPGIVPMWTFDDLCSDPSLLDTVPSYLGQHPLAVQHYPPESPAHDPIPYLSSTYFGASVPPERWVKPPGTLTEGCDRYGWGAAIKADELDAPVLPWVTRPKWTGT